jgi:hypothetical protein
MLHSPHRELADRRARTVSVDLAAVSRHMAAARSAVECAKLPATFKPLFADEEPFCFSVSMATDFYDPAFETKSPPDNLPIFDSLVSGRSSTTKRRFYSIGTLRWVDTYSRAFPAGNLRQACSCREPCASVRPLGQIHREIR